MRDKVTWAITLTVCAFMLLSLVGTFVLEFTGRETGGIWGRIFDLVNVLAGVVAGYIAGQQIQSTRDKEQIERLRKKASTTGLPVAENVQKAPREVDPGA